MKSTFCKFEIQKGGFWSKNGQFSQKMAQKVPLMKRWEPEMPLIAWDKCSGTSPDPRFPTFLTKVFHLSSNEAFKTAFLASLPSQSRLPQGRLNPISPSRTGTNQHSSLNKSVDFKLWLPKRQLTLHTFSQPLGTRLGGSPILYNNSRILFIYLSVRNNGRLKTNMAYLLWEAEAAKLSKIWPKKWPTCPS